MSVAEMIARSTVRKHGRVLPPAPGVIPLKQESVKRVSFFIHNSCTKGKGKLISLAQAFD
jgi:hypothetical protein